MPTTTLAFSFVGHGAVIVLAVLVIAMYFKPPRRLVLLSALCHYGPDLDILWMWLGFEQGHALSHRGFTHSFLMALLVSLFVVWLWDRKSKLTSAWKLSLFSWFFWLWTAHLFADMTLSASMGCQLFWPLPSGLTSGWTSAFLLEDSPGRFLFYWRPISGAPIEVESLYGPLWRAVPLEVTFAALHAIFLGVMLGLLKPKGLGEKATVQEAYQV